MDEQEQRNLRGSKINGEQEFELKMASIFVIGAVACFLGSLATCSRSYQQAMTVAVECVKAGKVYDNWTCMVATAKTTTTTETAIQGKQGEPQ